MGGLQRDRNIVKDYFLRTQAAASIAWMLPCVGVSRATLIRRKLPRRNKIVRLAYLDEAGISNPTHEPFLIVAGISINADNQFKAVETHLDELAKKHIPEEKRGRFAFHAMELFHGTKNFQRKDWPFEKRLEILDDLAAIPSKFDLPICFGVTDRNWAKSPEVLPNPTAPSLMEQIIHAHAFFKFVLQLEVTMRATAHDEVAMLIAEDRDVVRKMLKTAHAILRGRAPAQFRNALDGLKESGGLQVFDKLLPLERIVETVHFAQNGESSLLQVADICAFAIKRHLMKASHSQRLYDPISGQIVFTPRVVDAITAAAQS